MAFYNHFTYFFTFNSNLIYLSYFSSRILESSSAGNLESEKYQERIHSMELQMNEARAELIALSNELNATFKTAEKWKSVAENRQQEVDKLKEK